MLKILDPLSTPGEGRGTVSALLVYEQAPHVRNLQALLEELGLQTRVTSNCQMAARLLRESSVPHLVFADTILPDGPWTELLRVIRGAAVPVNMIVVSRLENIELYLDALERGAFDFLAPPFTRTHVAHVVRCGYRDVLSRRKCLAQAGLLSSAGSRN